MNKQIDKTFLGDLIVALLIGVHFINSLLCVILNTEEGFISILFVILGVLMLADLSSKHFKLRIEKKQMLFFLLITLGYTITTIFRADKSSLSWIAFTCRCLIPLAVGAMIQFSPKKVLKYLMILMILGIPFLSDLFAKGNAGSYDAVSMGTSYAILPVVLAGITHFILYYKESTVFEKTLYIVTLVYTAYFVMMSYRGSLFSLFIFVVLAFILRRKEKYNLRRFFVFVFGILVGILFIAYKNQLMVIISGWLSSWGVRIATLDKSLELATRDDELHGRMQIYVVAVKSIMGSPLFGHGYATFKYYTGYVYPHNFILEMCFDFGIPLGLFVAGHILLNIVRKLQILRRTSDSEFCFLLMIVCCSIPRVLVSAECWIVIILWFLVGLTSRSTLVEKYNQEIPVENK